MAIVACENCGKKYSDRAGECPFCEPQAKAVEIVPPRPRRPTARHTPGPQPMKTLLGLIGAGLLFVGVFCPVISAPIVGTINYFRNGTGDGIFVLAFAVGALVCVFLQVYRWLPICGLGAFAIMAITYVNFQRQMRETALQMEAQLAGNPFRGLADAAFQSVQLEWGWGILMLGALLLVLSALTPRPQAQAVHNL